MIHRMIMILKGVNGGGTSTQDRKKMRAEQGIFLDKALLSLPILVLLHLR